MNSEIEAEAKMERVIDTAADILGLCHLFTKLLENVK